MASAPGAMPSGSIDRRAGALQQGMAARPARMVREGQWSPGCAPHLMAIALTLLTMPGCNVVPGGEISTVGDGDRAARLATRFESGTFAIEPAQTTVVFSDIPYEELARGTAMNGQFLHIEVLWRPQAGKTPIDSTATNLSIRFVVVSKGEIGVYGGGGFGWITDGLETDSAIGIDITGSNLSLLDKTPGFVDLLSPATMMGELGAMKNAENARATRRAASQFVTNKLGKVRWVGAGATDPHALGGALGGALRGAARGAAAESAAATEASSDSRPASAGM